MSREHVYFECDGVRCRDQGHCVYCEGGLTFCTVCKQCEIELEPECPGPPKTHACRIPDCARPAKDGQLMCWPHWRRVPKFLNRQIFDTYRARDWSNYQLARDEAVRIVTLKDKGQEYDL